MAERLVPGLDPGALLGVAAVLVLLLVAARRRRRDRTPRPGELWFAQVPFEDRPGSKDRPVLVLQVEGRRCTVARLTSQDRGSRRDHVRVPDGVPGLRRESWANLRPVELPRSAFRRRMGEPGLPLVDWFCAAGRG